MGMDIHAFIECDLSKEYGHAEKPFTGIVSCFAEVYLERNYDLFGALGLIGVSGTLAAYKEIVTKEGPPRPPLFSPRGIPHPISAMARGSIELMILNEDKEERIIKGEDAVYGLLEHKGDTWVLKKDAERYVRNGQSRYLLNDDGIENKHFISDPNCEFSSWLFLDELKKTVSAAGFSRQIAPTVPHQKGEMKRAFSFFHFLRRPKCPRRIDELPWDYELLISTMEGIEKKIGSGRTRLFYWFDS